MPSVRRSTRIKNQNTAQYRQQSRSEEPLVQPNTPCSPCRNSDSSSESIGSISSKYCIACKQKYAPIRRFERTEWIQCDQCDNWWHGECACVSKETIGKLQKFEIDFTCALCVLKGSPWIRDVINEQKSSVKEIDINHRSGNSQTQSLKHNPDLPVTVISDKEISSKVGVENNDIKVHSDPANVVVVDNISSAKDFKSSKSIKENLCRYDQFSSVEFAYSLPRGGIAIHFDSKQKVEAALSNWPGTVFSSDEQPHKAKGKLPCTVGFLKNIDIRVQNYQLKDFLENQNCAVTNTVQPPYNSHLRDSEKVAVVGR